MRKKQEKSYGMVTPSIIHAGQAVPAAFINSPSSYSICMLHFLDSFLCVFFYEVLFDLIYSRIDPKCQSYTTRVPRNDALFDSFYGIGLGHAPRITTHRHSVYLSETGQGFYSTVMRLLVQTGLRYSSHDSDSSRHPQEEPRAG